MTVPEYFIAGLFMLETAVMACPTRPPPPSTPPAPNPAVYAEDCKLLYREELGREPDPEGLIGCQSQIALAASQGKTPPQETFRAFVRTQPEWIARQEAMKVVVLPRLVVRGQHLGLETGQRFTVIEASGFTLYQQFLDGGASAIEPQLQQLEDIGFNTVRVFGMYDNAPNPASNDPGRGGIGRFRPQDYGDRYWAGVAPFLQVLAKRHLYCEFVVFADATVVMPAAAAQIQHWNQFLQVVGAQ